MWVTETEPEFDASERDSWEALAEWRAARCPQCGNLKAICSDPGGLEGKGFHITQHVCYVAAARDSTMRRIGKHYEKSKPDLQGFLMTDGVSIGVALTEQPGEDVLGLAQMNNPFDRPDDET